MSGNSDTVELRITENQCDLIKEALQTLRMSSLQDLERIQDEDVFNTQSNEHFRLDARISMLETLLYTTKTTGRD